MEPLKAPALKPGDTVAVVAPAGPPDPILLERGVRFLRANGFKVLTGRHILERTGYLAGHDDQRADDFNTMLQSRDVRAIFCARGGYGSARIVDILDFGTLRKDPKIIVGFSDITTILAAVWKECRLITFHGPMVGSLPMSAWTSSQLLDQITGRNKAFHRWPDPPETGSDPRRLNTAAGHTVTEGRLFGGCLSLLTTLTGTPWDIDDATQILFMEDIGEAPYRIDRMLTHLRNAGWFQHVQAVIAGDFTRCIQRPDDPEPTPETIDVIRTFLDRNHLPAIFNLHFGHGGPALTIPFGGHVRIEGSEIFQTELMVEKSQR